MKDMLNSLKDKRILVTGHTGFKGSWLVTILSRYTRHLCGFSLEPITQPNLYSVLNIKSKLENEYIGVDIAKYGKINDCIREFDPDVIFHLAAQPLVRDSYDFPVKTYMSNTVGTMNLLEAVRMNISKKCAVVCITTDKVYANNEAGVPFSEDDKLGGYDPYSASKAACEIIIDSYRKSFFNINDYNVKHQIGIAACRAGNVIGGGDFSKDRIIVDIVKALSCNKQVCLRNPASVRPWQHVIEPLFGYIEIACRLLSDKNPTMYSSSWNFGPELDSQKTVEWLTKTAIKCFGKGEYVAQTNIQQPHEAKHLMLSIDKAKYNLAWKPKWDVENAIAKTIEWYKAYYDNGDMQKMTNSQIDKYMF